jgi:AraC-like DNA-binding protein
MDFDDLSKNAPVPLEFNIEKGYAIFSQSDYKTARHAHYAIEIVICTEGTFEITTKHKRHSNIKSVIIPPNLPHSFSCIGATCNLLFIDPLSATGRYFIQQFRLASRDDILIDPPELDHLHNKGKFDMPRILKTAETKSGGNTDPRVLTCIDAINSFVADHNVTVSQLAKASFLSPSRLAHLFKEQLGISVRQCILWKKIMLAVAKSREGYSITAAAHYAGFADSSHFNKVFNKMFGIKPFFVLKS